LSTTLTCPKCFGEPRVVSTRKAVSRPNATLRRRECTVCGHRFNTIEGEEDSVLTEAFIIELTLPDGSHHTEVVGDIARIGETVARMAGPRTYPATIHHWKCVKSINGPAYIEWQKIKVFKWP
jgi:hypothetical protein